MRCYNGNPVIHLVLIIAEILLTSTKQYAWFAMLRWIAILILQICGIIWFPQWMNGGWRRHTVEVRSMPMVFSGSAVSLYDDMNTKISSPAALKVTLLALYCFIWENYHHITYTAASSSSRQPVKIKVWFNVKKLWQKYISLLCSLKTQCNNNTTTTNKCL